MATAALLYTVGTAGLTVSIISDPVQSLAVEHSEGRTMAEEVAHWTELRALQFGLADDAHRLLSAAN